MDRNQGYKQNWTKDAGWQTARLLTQMKKAYFLLARKKVSKMQKILNRSLSLLSLFRLSLPRSRHNLFNILPLLMGMAAQCNKRDEFAINSPPIFSSLAGCLHFHSVHKNQVHDLSIDFAWWKWNSARDDAGKFNLLKSAWDKK